MKNVDKLSKIPVNVLLCTVLVAVVFFLYAKNLSGFWRYDDTQILLHALKYPWWKYFFDPHAWQSLSTVNLTPWVSLSFDLDLLFFGVNPFGFYLHHLISISAVSIATFYLLSLWTDKVSAFLGALLFIFGAPVVTVSYELMTRHYIEGLLFCVLSVYFFVLYSTTQKNRHVLISVAFYVLAISSKETYVPLVVLVLFLQREKFLHNFKSGIFQITPFLLVAFLYIVWRIYMLPSVVGGYSGHADFFSFAYWLLVFDAFARIPSLLAGSYWMVFLCLWLAVVLTCFYVMKEHILLTFLCFFLVLIPLVPLVASPGIWAPDRYLLLLWYLVCIAFAYFSSRLSSVSKGAMYAITLAWGFVFVIVGSHAQDITGSLNRKATESDVQMRFVWEHDQSFSFVPTDIITGSFWTFIGLSDIKKMLNDEATSPGAIVDDIYLKDKGKLFEYDETCRCMLDISGQAEHRLAQAENLTKKDAPLSINIINEYGLVRWSFGPYSKGNYRLISNTNLVGSFSLAKVGTVPTNIRDGVNFYLKYISPDSWITYSPLVSLPADGTAVHWERNKEDSTP